MFRNRLNRLALKKAPRSGVLSLFADAHPGSGHSRRHAAYLRLNSRTFEMLEPRRLLTTTIGEVMQADGTTPVEEATTSLTRGADTLTLRVDSRELPAGVYTMMVTAFNNPKWCSGKCSEDASRDVNLSQIFGGGLVVEDGGAAAFEVDLPVGTDAAIIDPSTVEVQFAIRSHGEASLDPVVLESQLNDAECELGGSNCPTVQTGQHMSPTTVVSVEPVLTNDHFLIALSGTRSRMTRSDDSVSITIDTRQLPGGAENQGAFTVEFVVFNHPENCVFNADGRACSEVLDTEVENGQRERTEVSRILVTGGLSNPADRSASFEATLLEGDASNTLYGPGMLDTYGSEIHAFIRYHNWASDDPEGRHLQTTTFDGGCVGEGVTPCEDVQVMIHLAAAPPAPSLTFLEQTSSGFVSEFSTELDTSVLNLYDSGSAEFGEADVTVVGATTGPVTGSLQLGPGNVTFIKSGGPLAADTYTVTLRSADDGFKSPSGGLLNTEGTVINPSNLGHTFTVPAPPTGAITISMPDFVRGPGQDVNLPDDTNSGIPLSLSEAAGVRTVDLQISYDPSLLEITGATVGAEMPEGATVILSTAGGLATLSFESPTALPSGAGTIVNLHASVPATEVNDPYQSQHILDLHSVDIRDGSENQLPAIANDALHHASFFGDVSGNGRINASDAAQVARVAALLDGGFAATLLTDPRIVGDISGNGRINAADASLVARSAALIDVPEIPPIPVATAAASGTDADRIGGHLLVDRQQHPREEAAIHLNERSSDATGWDGVLNRFGAVGAQDRDRWESSAAAAEEEASMALKEAIDEIFAELGEGG